MNFSKTIFNDVKAAVDSSIKKNEDKIYLKVFHNGDTDTISLFSNDWHREAKILIRINKDSSYGFIECGFGIRFRYGVEVAFRKLAYEEDSPFCKKYVPGEFEKFFADLFLPSCIKLLDYSAKSFKVPVEHKVRTLINGFIEKSITSVPSEEQIRKMF